MDDTRDQSEKQANQRSILEMAGEVVRLIYFCTHLEVAGTTPRPSRKGRNVARRDAWNLHHEAHPRSPASCLIVI